MQSGPAITPAPGLVIRLRPTSPWRFGPDSGARDRVDPVAHSDTLHSAVSAAMAVLGHLPEWLAETAQSESGPAVKLSSCFPSLDDTLFVPPPQSHWPPPPSPKVRWVAARFVPFSLVETLLSGEPVREDAWTVDEESGCLLPSGRVPKGGPFRIRVRSAAAVDRPSFSRIEPYSTACLEFAPRGGAWMALAFRDAAARERWGERVASAFRLLADTGIGGERSQGWGRFEIQAMTPGVLPDLLLRIPTPAAPAEPNEDHAGKTAYWLLSLFSPAPADAVEWGLGAYSLMMRAGRVESPVRWGVLKRSVRMVSEGSVLVSRSALVGAAPDVAPEGFPHPVYRAGYALGFAIPWKPPAAALPYQRKAAEPALAPAPVPAMETPGPAAGTLEPPGPAGAEELAPPASPAETAPAVEEPAPPAEPVPPPAPEHDAAAEEAEPRSEAAAAPETAAAVEEPPPTVEAVEPPMPEPAESPMPEPAEPAMPEPAEPEAPVPPSEVLQPSEPEPATLAGEPAKADELTTGPDDAGPEDAAPKGETR